MRGCWRSVAAGVGFVLAACTARPAATPAHAAVDRDAQAWRDAEPATGARGTLSFPAPEVAKLDNGMTLYVVHRPAGVVSLSFVVRHGASSLERGKSGLAALVARMLTEGTRDHTGQGLAESVEDLGATLDHDAGRDFTRVGLTVLRADARRGLELLAEVALRPAFAPDVFDRVRQQWLDDLAAERQDPGALAAIAGFRLLMGPVQGAPVTGSEPDVRRLGVRDLVGFHRRFFVPGASALIVVGDLAMADARPEVERVFGAWRGPDDVPPPRFVAPPPPRRPRVVVIDRPGSVQSALFVAQPFPRRTAAGHEARELLGEVLGGLFTSRINRNLREVHAYTYGARSEVVAARLWGALVTTTSVRTDATGNALAQIRREISDVRQRRPVGMDELERARADRVSSLGADLQSVDGIAGDVDELFFAGLPDDYLAVLGSTIDRVALASVRAEARSRLLPDQMLVVVVGDRAKVEAQLRPLGADIEDAPPGLSR